jgi:hypothetical protein
MAPDGTPINGGMATVPVAIAYTQFITTQTHTRMDPGEYTGATDPESGEREGEGDCKWVDGSNYTGQWSKGFRHG